MKTLNWDSDSLQTSQEILDAIYQIAPMFADETQLMNIWLDPSDAEIISIQEIVTKSKMIDPTEFFWSGSSHWAINQL